MSETGSTTVWVPSKRQPGRIHATGKTGAALCGAGVDIHSVRCALCTLALHDHPDAGPAPFDLRARIEADCAESTDALPQHLLAVTGSTANALDTLCVLLTDAYVEGENAIRMLDLRAGNSQGRAARAHLVDALVALNVAFSGHSAADAALRYAT